MSKPSDRYVKVVAWSEEDQCYIGRCPGLMLGGVHGSDERAVYAELCDVVVEWMRWLVPTEAQRESIARALGEVGQTRTWNLKLDVIARKREIRAGGNGAPKI